MNWKELFFHILAIAEHYFIMISVVFFIFYILLKRKIAYKKIQLKFPKVKDYKRDILYSLSSIIIFALPVFILLRIDSIREHTTYYSNIHDHGKLYLIFALILMIFMHDAYFYWMHRLIHHPRLFKAIHLIHHKSTNPSPWTSYAFHPFEAILESLIIVIFLFTIPIHPILLVVFYFFSIAMNVYGHLGFELFPKRWSEHWFGKWISTSVYHNQHHHGFTKNYGLYFTIWDRLMGTFSVDYNEAYKEVKTRVKTQIRERVSESE